MIVLGMLSGTSMDGIDVAVCDLNWDADTIRLTPLGDFDHPWPPELRARLQAALPPAPITAQELCELDTLCGQEFAAAAASVTDQRGDVELIVSHGQNLYHWIAPADVGEAAAATGAGQALGTLQIGQPAWIVERTGLPVISDLRARDVAAGGQGAPLASTLDQLWLAGMPGVPAALNLGGIANITVLTVHGKAVAFDIGPANCLIDIAAERVTGGAQRSDIDGRIAALGSVRDDLLNRLLGEPYFDAPAPKSTGRELFSADFLDAALNDTGPVADADLLATLTELTAVTVARACERMKVTQLVASGGGVRNPVLIAALRAQLGDIALLISDELGLPAAAKEGYLFALLGFLSWYQVPGVVPGATGSGTPRVLGRISPGDEPMRLPPPAAAPRRLVIDVGFAPARHH